MHQIREDGNEDEQAEIFLLREERKPNDEFAFHDPPSKANCWKQSFVAGILLFSGFTTLALISLWNNLSASAPLSLGNCGRSVAEARNNGCIFDIMMSSWIPPACYDRELSNSFISENNWTWYEEREGVTPVPQEVVREGNFTDLYTRGDFHMQHCLYLWAKQTKVAYGLRNTVDSVDKKHIFHCIKALGSPNMTLMSLKTGTSLHVNFEKSHECFRVRQT